MALLFGNISATDSRLRNQLVLPKRGRDLRKPVFAVQTHVDAEQYAMQAHPADKLSCNEHYRTASGNGAARDVYDLSPSSRLDECKHAHQRQRQTGSG